MNSGFPIAARGVGSPYARIASLRMPSRRLRGDSGHHRRCRGAAHLPGMLRRKLPLPVIGVPIPTENLRGLIRCCPSSKMPRGIPVATVAIGGAENAAILAAQILGLQSAAIRQRVEGFRTAQNTTRARLSRRRPVIPPFAMKRSSGRAVDREPTLSSSLARPLGCLEAGGWAPCSPPQLAGWAA